MFKRAGLAVSTVIAVVTAVIAATFAVSPHASAVNGAVSFVGTQAAQGTSRGMRVGVPAGTTSGDLQVAVVALASGTERVRTPHGWSKVLELRGGGGAAPLFKTAVFTSRSTGAVQFRKSGRNAWQVVRTAYRDAASVMAASITGTSGTDHVLPTMTPTDATDVVVGGVVAAGQPWSTSVDAPWSERFDRVATRKVVAVALDDVTAGSASPLTGVVHSTRATSSTTFSMVLASVASAERRYKTSPPSPTPTATTTSAAPAPTTTSTTSVPSSTATTTSGTGSSATITQSGGVPWRPGDVSDPGYSNTLLTSSATNNSGETTLLRTLGGVLLNIDEYTEPVYYRTTMDTPVRTVTCIKYGCVGGTTAPLTGDEVVAPGTDGQLVVVDLQGRRTYEFYQLQRDADGTVAIGSDGSVTAGSMSVVDLDGRGNKTAGGKNLNITGAGVSRLFGVIRANEIRAAATDPRTAIPHALSVSLPVSMNCSSFREPATKTDGRVTSGSCIQEGARFRLDPSFDCSTVSSKMGQAVCYALQKYGAYDMDNNGTTAQMVVYAQHRKSWSTGSTDYANVGITSDYQKLDLSMSRMSSLVSWTGN